MKKDKKMKNELEDLMGTICDEGLIYTVCHKISIDSENFPTLAKDELLVEMWKELRENYYELKAYIENLCINYDVEYE